MKSCPTCNRTFEDTFTFCLIDGAVLSAPFDPHATLIIPESKQTEPPPTHVLKSEEETSHEIPPTIASPKEEQSPEDSVTTITAPAPVFESPQIEASPGQPARTSTRSPLIIVGIGALLLIGLVVFIIANRADSTNENAANKNAVTANTSSSSIEMVHRAETATESVVVGSKDFTESVLIAEIFSQLLEARGVKVVRQFELAGNVLHESLVAGEIDCYPEYSGTSYMAILKYPFNTDARTVYQTVKRDYAEKFNVEVGPPLGFDNTFAILVRGEVARRLGLRTISDAVPHATSWRAGFGQDFMSRADGYFGFARTYNLRFSAAPREMDLSLTYRALADGQVDLVAGNSTDGLISTLDLVQLEDDRHYFPPYEALILIRRDTLKRVPAASEVLSQLSGRLTTEEIRRLNYEVDSNRRDVREVAREWIARTGLR